MKANISFCWLFSAFAFALSQGANIPEVLTTGQKFDKFRITFGVFDDLPREKSAAENEGWQKMSGCSVSDRDLT